MHVDIELEYPNTLSIFVHFFSIPKLLTCYDFIKGIIIFLTPWTEFM